MGTLVLFNFLLIAIISLVLLIVKKNIKGEKAKNLTLLIASIITILFHYSAFFYSIFTEGAIEYLREYRNLLLPIYPCNVVMWSCLVYPLCKNKESKLARFLADYIFWFGILSTLVGMFANVDFIMNPTLKDYEITKSIVAHATLLFNVLLFPVFGRIKIDLFQNLKHIAICIIEMLVIGAYCNLLIAVIGSEVAAYDVNSMFLIHSPFDGLAFLTYPVIALIALPLYFLLFAVCEHFAYEKGERFYDRIKNRKNN